VSSNALGNNTYELLIINPKTSGILTAKSQSCSKFKIVTTATLMPNFGFTSDEFKKYNYFSVNNSIEFTNLFDTSKIPDDNRDNRVVWSFGDNTPSKVFYSNDKDSNSDGESFKTVFHTYTTSGIFEVTLALFNSSGCFKSITKSITIESGNTIMIPTAFSPNDDGYNDFFSPYLIGFKEVSIYIYDNWSNLVYEGNLDVQLGPKEDWGWNGIEKGNTEPKNGTYRYYIMAKTIDNKIIQKKGEFLLIK
jgi:gliding motility-associated-like protein